MPIVATSVIDQVSAALSARSLQHEAIASNIANREVPGYQRLKTSFDAVLERDGAVTQAGRAAEPVSLEQDIAALTANTSQYEALARTLSRYFAIVGVITNAGRG